MQVLIVFISIGLMGVGCLIGLFSIIDTNDKSASIGLITCLIGGILLGLAIFVSVRCEKQSWKREDPYVTHSIIALTDGNEIEGKFRGSRYAMSGYINEKFMYVYGYKTAGGGMRIQKTGADTTVVYFRDDMKPCAKWYKETRTFWWCTQTRTTCDIFVPTDSLDARITIDLEG